ncbi:hypothetical protein HYV70_00140 [Candidatus Uhrbacteria bacterium]|nr:hypothetical protein [Candidatus Uhrbacteria bacterium]
MRNLFSGLIVFFSLISSSLAFGQDADTTPSPDGDKKEVGIRPGTPCAKVPGLIDLDKDGFCTTVEIDAVFPMSFKQDCRDDVKAINPGATEKVADGIDQDCDGEDLNFPDGVTASIYKVFVRNEYGGRDPGAKLFVQDFDTCTEATAPATCEIDLVLGKFVPAKGYVFEDVYVDGVTGLLNRGCTRDGQEMVLETDAAHNPRICENTGGGVSMVRVEGLVNKERKAREKALKRESEEREKALKRESEEREALKKALDSYSQGVDAQIAGLVTTDTNLSTRMDGFESYGPLVSVAPTFGVMFRKPLQEVDQNDVPTGNMVREAVLPLGGFNLRAGVDAAGFQVLLRLDVGFGNDGEGAGDSAYQFGVEAMFEKPMALPVNVSLMALYGVMEDHATVVDLSAIDRSVLLGSGVSYDLMKKGHFVLSGYGEGFIGYSLYGTRGETSEGSVPIQGSGLTGGVRAGLSATFGALK